MLKVVIAHVDFSLYWPARLKALRARLAREDGTLLVLETAAGGGAYDFAGRGNGEALDWVRLYDGVKLQSLPPAAVARRIWDALEQHQPDVVVCGAIAFTPGATAVRWCRRRRRGVVVMDDARLTDVPRSALVNAIKRRVYANVDAMLVPAESHLGTCEYFGVDARRVFFGVNVVDNDAFADRVRTIRGSGRRTLGGHFLPNRFFLGGGRLVAKKNWPLLVRAYARYRRRVAVPWDLVIVGGGPDHATLLELVRAEGLSGGTHLIPAVAPEEMPVAYANAGCLVLPSFHGETWGLVVNEAMASGLTVLVSDQCGCATTLVEPGGNGWTFSPHDVDQLTSLLVRVSSLDDAARAAMGERSRQIIAGWSVDRFASGACDAIRACANVSRGFAGPLDRALLSLWKGRFRPT